MKVLDTQSYLEALRKAERPGSNNYLAYYDHRIGAICTDPTFLFIPLDDHLCHRGDGLFESICFRKGRIFAFDAHIERMQEGAQALHLVPPCSWDELRSATVEVARATGQENGDLRIFLSRGPGGFGVSPRECPRAGLYIVAIRAKEYPPEFFTRGVTAFTSRIPPKQPYLATIKSTNYLPNVFMAEEASEKGMDVAVSFDEDGVMGEAAVANIALIDNEGNFLCPEFSRILPGTTLLQAMRLARTRLPVVQRPIRHADIEKAKEVLLLTSSSLCVAVTAFDGVAVGETKGKPGPIAHWLRQALFESYCREGYQL